MSSVHGVCAHKGLHTILRPGNEASIFIMPCCSCIHGMAWGGDVMEINLPCTVISPKNMGGAGGGCNIKGGITANEYGNNTQAENKCRV